MMPMPYGSFSLQLIALTSGVALFIWSLNSDDRGTILGRFFGFIVMILAFLSILCTSYTSIKYWMQPDSVYEVVEMQGQMKDTTTPSTTSSTETHKEKSTTTTKKK